MLIKSWIEENFQKIIDIRRWLHQHPEVGFDEHETSKYCQDYMMALGDEIHRTEPMKTGFYCNYGKGNGPTLAVRCDLDALPIQEINTVDYCSVNAIKTGFHGLCSMNFKTEILHIILTVL